MATIKALKALFLLNEAPMTYEYNKAPPDVREIVSTALRHLVKHVATASDPQERSKLLTLVSDISASAALYLSPETATEAYSDAQ
jgi:hypothetical protein